MKRIQQSKHALGSAAILTIVADNDAEASKIFDELWQQVDAFEQRFSRFLATSELTRINHAAGKSTKISHEMHALLAAAKAMAQTTNGLYNPFILPSLQRAGYKGSWPAPAQVHAQINYENRQPASGKDIVLGRGSITIPANTALDFGGIGKGYLLDQLSDWLLAQHINNYWLSLGGDIICNGVDETGEPWTVTVQNAVSEDEIAATVNNHSKLLAIATSGVTKRKGISAHGAWHHIIDPRTLQPAVTNILTATVCATLATDADVFAKCLVIDPDTKKCMQQADVQNALLQRVAPDGAVLERIGTIWS